MRTRGSAPDPRQKPFLKKGFLDFPKTFKKGIYLSDRNRIFLYRRKDTVTMAKLQIRKVGDEALRKVCRPVDTITPRVLTLLDDMVETMRAANGVGLAAPQVGILRRIVVIEVEGQRSDEVYTR